MKIRTKLILNYSILSIILLFLFSIIVVISYIRYRQNDFNTRLHNRAITTVNMLMNESSIDSSMLRMIDRNIITAMSELQVTIYDQDNKLIYTNSTMLSPVEPDVNNTTLPGFLESFSLGLKTITFDHYNLGKKYRVEASAIDTIGYNAFKGLLKIISWVLAFSLILIAGFGFYNAVWSLKPFKKIIQEVDEIDPSLIKRRVSVQGSDEISQLAKAFNTLLDRIEESFETEKSFISNASHELRTPVTSVLGQIEVALNKSRSEEEYKNILQSVYDDSSQMANIINGFLDLASANLAENKIVLNPVRIDELIFAIIDDFERRKPHYHISVDFKSNPETDTQLECIGNDRLLRLMFSNLIDNACKYSSDKRAIITIDFLQSSIIVSIIDHGIGIPEPDQSNIFKPLYRASNVSGIPGHGIGLAIVKRIADMHNCLLNIKSDLNIGTTITLNIMTDKTSS